MNLIIGIAIGAAFSKFWIMVYEYCKNFVISKTKNDQY